MSDLPMKTLLHIDSSARKAGSISRQITADFVERWKAANSSGKVIKRDLFAPGLPHLTEEMISAFFISDAARSASQQKSMVLSDELTEEFLAADEVIIGAPMYNWSVTSSLKVWIDHIIRVNRTLTFGNGMWPEGLPAEKKVTIAISRGGLYLDGEGQAFDFQTGYLKLIMSFMGITDLEFIFAEGLALGKDAAQKALDEAKLRAAARI